MKKLLILLHGVGSSGQDMQMLARHLEPALPGVVIATPDGPSHFDGGGAGYQWFSLAGITEQSRPARILAARQDFDGVLHGILQQHDIHAETDRIMLAGFSQGAIMALDALVSHRLPLCGVVAFSGRLASPGPYHPAARAAALLIHGKADPVIPWEESERAAASLADAGVAVSTLFEPGVPHTLSTNGVQQAAAFIGQRFDLN